MPRRRHRPLTLWVGALVLPLCLVGPVRADPEVGIIVPPTAHADEVLPQHELVATAEITPAAELDTRDVAVELFEAALPRDVPAPAGRDLAAASPREDEPSPEAAAEFVIPVVDVALFEAGLPPDIPAAAASTDPGDPLPKSAAELDVPGFDVALFEAGLPRDLPQSAAPDPAAPLRTAASADARKPPLTSAATHPRNKTPAAKQPLRSAAARGKTSEPARTSRPAARKLAAGAPPATITQARRRATVNHGPRELFIGRLPPDERDEVMPALRPIPVLRGPLPPPPPSLALR